MFVENFRNIRVGLQLSAPAERQRTILVTSAKPEDGKTMCVSNLGLAIAQTGRRVLIVDANFRRPAIHSIYNLDSTPGLSNMLIGEGNLEGTARRTDVPNLDVLASGPTPPNPVELLGSPEMRKVLEDAIRIYDQVIIDAPPVLLATDGLVLSTLVDGVILVVRAKENSRGIANRAVNLLQRVNAHLFGCILNRAQAQRGGYFREQLRTYYDYHELDQLESQSSKRKKLPKKDEEDEDDDAEAKADASDDASNEESTQPGFHHKSDEDEERDA
jgi:capsular exopolysaccharide synthesis family protein